MIDIVGAMRKKGPNLQMSVLQRFTLYGPMPERQAARAHNTDLITQCGDPLHLRIYRMSE